MKTTISQIVYYWTNHSEICETELNFDWSDAGTHCWNCGDNKKRTDGKISLDRCHIVPQSLGGEDVPSNYVLLCSECHMDSPNVSSSKYMWEWILSNKRKLALYNIHRIEGAFELFSSKKGYSFHSVLSNSTKDYNLILNEVLDSSTYHFGRRINVQTYYYLLCELEDRLK